MSKMDPWTDPDPQPGDFDEFFASIDPRDPRHVQVNEGDPDAIVTFLPPGMDEDDARRLVALAVERRTSVREILAERAHAA